VLGQGTVGLEFEEQTRIDTLLVAVAARGLIAGLAAWYAGRIKIIAVEPVKAPTLARALYRRKHQFPDAPRCNDSADRGNRAIARRTARSSARASVGALTGSTAIILIRPALQARDRR